MTEAQLEGFVQVYVNAYNRRNDSDEENLRHQTMAYTAYLLGVFETPFEGMLLCQVGNTPEAVLAGLKPRLVQPV